MVLGFYNSHDAGCWKEYLVGEEIILVEEKERVFIISPIGDEGTPIRNRADVIADYIVAPVAEEFDLRVDRSDRDPTPGPITSKLLRSMLDSRIIVADLTGHNPNVFYELCFAHSFGLPVVILIDKAENLPFDTKNERAISLGDEGSIDMQQGEIAKQKLRDAFNKVLEEGYKSNSLVNEVAGVQNIENMTPEDPVASELQAIKQRVDQIYKAVGTSGSSKQSGFRQADVTSLLKLVESFIAAGNVSTEKLNDLVTDKTSDTFDEWVSKMKRVHEAQILEADLEDLPF